MSISRTIHDEKAAWQSPMTSINVGMKLEAKVEMANLL